MAEFVEVMRQARRMCDMQKDTCKDCPAGATEGRICRLNVIEISEDDVEVERIVMDWAAEHPEPVYPSWIDAWQQLFPGAKNVPCPKLYFGADCTDGSGEGCIVCKRSPISAEIAEKLGIKPKEE